MINNKKILVVCKETYTFPMLLLARELRKRNEIAAFFPHPVETKLKKCRYNRYTYYQALNEGMKVYTCNDIVDEFSRKYRDYENKVERLYEIDNKYGKNRCINLQLVSSQYFSTAYHNRHYYKDATYGQQLFWYELNVTNSERILSDFCPDMILDIDFEELGRTVLHEVAEYNNIPYLTIGQPRVGLYKYCSYDQNQSPGSNFYNAYQKLFSGNIDELRDEIEYVNNFRNEESIMSIEYKGTITAKYSSEPMLLVLKNFMHSTLLSIEAELKGGKWWLRRSNKILFPNHLRVTMEQLLCDLRRRKLCRANRYFDSPDPEESYYYMPLHLIPESSVMVDGPFYANEMAIIEAVSKSLPAGDFLYVKEHQAMLGERSFSFYNRIKKLPNVKMVPFNYYNDPKPWIAGSKGVITITGTSAYEAVMLGKPAYVFGDAIFNVINGVTRIRTFEELPIKLRDSIVTDNTKSCAAYIKAIKSISEEINIYTLINEGRKVIMHSVLPSDILTKNVLSMEKVFESGIEFLDRGINSMKNN